MPTTSSNKKLVKGKLIAINYPSNTLDDTTLKQENWILIHDIFLIFNYSIYMKRGNDCAHNNKNIRIEVQLFNLNYNWYTYLNLVS